MRFYFWKFVHNQIHGWLMSWPYEPEWVKQAHDMSSERWSHTAPSDDIQTPLALATYLTNMAEISSEHRVLEPSAGAGNLITVVVSRFPEMAVDYCERRVANVFNIQKTIPLSNWLGDDFLSLKPDPSYDRIIMAPPFGDERDVEHVLHALGFLKRDGKLVALVNAKLKDRKSEIAKRLRGIISERGHSIDLPEHVLNGSGSTARVTLVCIHEPDRLT
jgi:hypothetical protein